MTTLMISNALITDEDLEKNKLIKLDWAKFIRDKYAIHPRIVSSDPISTINPPQSTDVSYYLFSQSKPSVNEHHSKSDSIDWTNHRSKTSSIQSTVNHQLNTIEFLREYSQPGNRDVLIALLDREISPRRSSAMNNNHFHSASMWNSSLQLSNNKEKRISSSIGIARKKTGVLLFYRKEKSDEKEKKDEIGKQPIPRNSLEKTTEDMDTKKSKKSKTKSKKIEETTTSADSESDVHRPSPSFHSPVETVFPSLSIPVPHSSTQSFISPDSSRVHIPQSPNIAHLSEQLQTDSQNISVQQQLQSLSQMARDGDEILITLSVNALTQKQQTNGTQQDQLSRYAAQIASPIGSPSNGMIMPRNLEIVAKGFARVQHKHPQPPPSNPHRQQSSVTAPYNPQAQPLVHPSFVPRYPMPCYWSSGPPQIPIAPAIQPIFTPWNTMMPNEFNRPANPTDLTFTRRNYPDSYDHRFPLNAGKCDYLCQSSLAQPDFRGRPSPSVTINPYIPPSSVNFPATHSSQKHRSYHSNIEDINRTYSSIY